MLALGGGLPAHQHRVLPDEDDIPPGDDEARLTAVVVYGKLRLFGLLGREEDRVFPWEAVRRFGADTILVETPPLSRLGKGN